MVQIMRQSLFDWSGSARAARRAALEADIAAAEREARAHDARFEAVLEPTADALSREQLIDRILFLNPTAEVAFLDGFEEPGLRQYLHRLQHAHAPRGRHAVWTRPIGVRPVGCWATEI
ncbi:MAG: hypothetical protein AAF297_07270 [Planctomycetota bacterium]